MSQQNVPSVSSAYPFSVCHLSVFFFLTLLLLQRENLQKQHKSDLQQILHFEERQDDPLIKA
jgi:hypothetical protein